MPILFNRYAKDTLTRKGIKLVNCYDAYGAIVFARFLHRNKRPVVFMVDNDTTINKGTRRLLTRAALEKAGFSISEQVHFIGPECFEYAFPNEVWARVLNENQPQTKKDWTPEVIQSYRKGAAQFIKKMSEILQEDSKPRIGIMLAKAVQSGNDIPSGVKACFDHAMGLANP